MDIIVAMHGMVVKLYRIGKRGDQTIFIMMDMLLDTGNPYTPNYFICNPPGNTPTTTTTTAPPTPVDTTCGDWARCVTLDGFDDDRFNAQWNANGSPQAGTCYSGYSYYTLDGVDNVYMCLYGNNWIITS